MRLDASLAKKALPLASVALVWLSPLSRLLVVVAVSIPVLAASSRDFSLQHLSLWSSTGSMVLFPSFTPVIALPFGYRLVSVSALGLPVIAHVAFKWSTGRHRFGSTRSLGLLLLGAATLSLLTAIPLILWTAQSGDDGPCGIWLRIALLVAYSIGYLVFGADALATLLMRASARDPRVLWAVAGFGALEVASAIAFTIVGLPAVLHQF